MDDVKQIWKTQKYTFIQECRFDVIINAEQSLKEYAFNLLMIYLDGKVFAAENIIKDPLALQKYNVWQNSKRRMQTSFASSSSASLLPEASKSKKINKLNKSMARSFAHEHKRIKTRSSHGIQGNESLDNSNNS